MKNNLLFILMLFSIGACQVLGLYQYKSKIISDHFDGNRFYNIDPLGKKDFWDLLKWKMNSKAKKWPQDIEDKVNYAGPKSRVSKGLSYTFINHATVLIQTSGLNILTDPIFSKRASPFRWIGPRRCRKPGVLKESLPKIDIVLISHNHYDHMDLDSLAYLNEKFSPTFLVGLGNKILLESYGISNIVELDWWEEYILASTKIYFTPARHFSSRGIFDDMKTLWGSYVIKTMDYNIYFSGDTGYGKHFKLISDRYGSMDLAFIPIGAYEPRWFMKDVHVNPEESVLAHIDLESKYSVGIHFGTFQLSDEGIEEPKVDLIKALSKHSIDTKLFVVPNFGETISVFGD